MKHSVTVSRPWWQWQHGQQPRDAKRPLCLVEASWWKHRKLSQQLGSGSVLEGIFMLQSHVTVFFCPVQTEPSFSPFNPAACLYFGVVDAHPWGLSWKENTQQVKPFLQQGEWNLTLVHLDRSGNVLSLLFAEYNSSRPGKQLTACKDQPQSVLSCLFSLAFFSDKTRTSNGNSNGDLKEDKIQRQRNETYWQVVQFVAADVEGRELGTPSQFSRLNLQ